MQSGIMQSFSRVVRVKALINCKIKLMCVWKGLQSAFTWDNKVLFFRQKAPANPIFLKTLVFLCTQSLIMLNSSYKECIFSFEYWAGCCSRADHIHCRTHKVISIKRTHKVISIAQNCSSHICLIWKAGSAPVITKSWETHFLRFAQLQDSQIGADTSSSFTLMEIFHSAKHHYCFHYISSPYAYCAEWRIQENRTVPWTGKFFTCYLHICPCTIIPTKKSCRVKIAIYLQCSILICVGALFIYYSYSFPYAENYFWPPFTKMRFCTLILVLWTVTGHKVPSQRK